MRVNGSKFTPAEAVLMVDPKASSAGRCVQAGLLALLAAERISVRRGKSLFQESTLTLRDEAGERGLAPHLRTIDEALRTYGRGSILPREQVLQALQRAFGLGMGRYVHDHLAPELVARGLLSCERPKVLGLFPVRRYALTPSGEAQAQPLKRLFEALDGMPKLMKTDPERALRLAQSAGVLLTMSPKARRQLSALRKLLADRGSGDGGSAVTYSYGGDDEDGEWSTAFDLCDMALALDAEALIDCVDAVGDFTDGGGGSSDGGGDGGGGGGD